MGREPLGLAVSQSSPHLAALGPPSAPPALKPSLQSVRACFANFSASLATLPPLVFGCVNDPRNA
eukprot:1149535-Pelagomonas_calceolata.AAC.4